MTLKYSKSLSGALLTYAFTRRYPSNQAAYSIGIYKGERPTPKEIELNWRSYSRYGTDGKGAGSNLLWNGNLNMIMNAELVEWYSQNITATAPPIQAGTATWALLMTNGGATPTTSPWMQNVNTLTGGYVQIITVGVSLLDGDAPVRLETLELDPANGNLDIVELSLRGL